MAKKSIPLEVIDLNGNGFHVLVNIMLFKKPFKLVLDTGASKTAFDKTLLLELIHEKELKNSGHLTTGLGTNDMQSFTTEIQDFYIGKFHIPILEVAVLDLSAINIAYQQLAIAPVLGVLGGDVLVKYQTVINYAECKLTLKRVEQDQ
ncbi:MAG: aspartyl protease family protein [Janthinobacterium lividum]